MSDNIATGSTLKNQEIINKMLPIFKRYPVKKVALFGSFARGENTSDSDIDIIADLGTNDSYNSIDYIYLLWDELEETLGVSVDLITLNALNFHSTYTTTKKIMNDMRWIYEV